MVKSQKIKKVRFVLDCSAPVASGVVDVAEMTRFFQDRVKVEGKTNNLGSKVAIESDGADRITFECDLPFSKRYIKYLAKKYLKKNMLREYMRVVASKKDTYVLSFFAFGDEEAEEQE